MKVDFVTVGRVWDLNNPHVIQAYMMDYARALGEEIGAEPQYLHWKSQMPDAPCLVIYPGFQLPGGAAVARTKALLTDAHLRKAKVVIFCLDNTAFKPYVDLVKELRLTHGIATSFQKPWKCWPTVFQFHDRIDWCPEWMIDLDACDRNMQPKFACGYVGWPKPHRFRVIRQIGYRSLVLLGKGCETQDEFPCAMTDMNTPYNNLAELYRRVAWSVCISDNDMNPLGPNPSRHLESWACGRPCLFHESVCEGRVDVPWDLVRPYVFKTAVELHEKSRVGLHPDGTYDLDVLRRIADEQRGHLYQWMFRKQAKATMAARWFSGLDDWPSIKELDI